MTLQHIHMTHLSVATFLKEKWVPESIPYGMQSVKQETEIVSGLQMVIANVPSCTCLLEAQHRSAFKVLRVLPRAAFCSIWSNMRKLKAAKCDDNLDFSSALDLCLATQLIVLPHKSTEPQPFMGSCLIPL